LAQQSFASNFTLIQLNLTKIEQLGSGAVYCQVIDVIHPGKIALAKVKWNAKNDYEFIGNLRILQNAFDKIGIKRYVEVRETLFRYKSWLRQNIKTILSLLSGSNDIMI
jgi:hypothetical protein